MALQKLQECNKMIAEFMGAEPDEEYPTLYFIEPHLNDNGTHDFHIGNMKYHTSWDWLMPVVEKITKIRYDGEVKVDEQYCWAYFRTFFYQPQPDGTLMAMVRINRMGLHTAPTLIEATWNAIVEFLQGRKILKEKDGNRKNFNRRTEPSIAFSPVLANVAAKHRWDNKTGKCKRCGVMRQPYSFLSNGHLRTPRGVYEYLVNQEWTLNRPECVAANVC